MTKAIAKTYETINEHRLHLTLLFVAACVAMASICAFNVYKVISRTVATQSVRSEIVALQNSVDSLDSEYLSLSSKITPDSAAAYGMTQGQVSQYIVRTVSLGRGVALSGYEL